MEKVSVLIATFNRLPDLYGCLLSLENQVGEFELEACVVNDGGTSIEPVVSCFVGSRLSIRYVEQTRNVGQVAARNLALERATGAYIALCDDDDRWMPNHVQSLLSALKREDAVLAFSDTELVWINRSQTHPRVLRRAPFAWENAASLLRRYNPIAPSSVLYRRELHNRVGQFDAAVNHYWDWDFWLRALEVGPIVRVPECSTLYGIYTDGSNLSSQPEQMSPFLQRLIEKHHLGSLPSSNFGLMLEDEQISTEQAQTSRIWDGGTEVWFPRRAQTDSAREQNGMDTR